MIIKLITCESNANESAISIYHDNKALIIPNANNAIAINPKIQMR